MLNNLAQIGSLRLKSLGFGVIECRYHVMSDIPFQMLFIRASTVPNVGCLKIQL